MFSRSIFQLDTPFNTSDGSSHNAVVVPILGVEVGQVRTVEAKVIGVCEAAFGASDLVRIDLACNVAQGVGSHTISGTVVAVNPSSGLASLGITADFLASGGFTHLRVRGASGKSIRWYVEGVVITPA